MPSKEARKSALRRYIVFRIKVIEFLDLNALRHSLRLPQLANKVVPLPSFPPFRPSRFVADSVRTVVLSWFCLFIDTSGMNVIEVWSEVFPKHAAQVQEAWRRMAPAWKILRRFRNRAGFHADKPIRFFEARHTLREQWPTIEKAMAEFEVLLKLFLKAEAQELPELESELDSLLDELEKKHGSKYNREQFKAYVMIANTRIAPEKAS